MTPEQIELARHALGLTRQRISFRNHYVVGPGNADFDNWQAMVAAGHARHRTGSPLSGGDDIFWLTHAGALLALRRGEKLDPEQFRVAVNPSVNLTEPAASGIKGEIP